MELTDQKVEQFGLLCDAIERILYAEQDQIASYKTLLKGGDLHTSSEARKAAHAAFAALGMDWDHVDF